MSSERRKRLIAELVAVLDQAELALDELVAELASSSGRLTDSEIADLALPIARQADACSILLRLMAGVYGT